MNYPLRQVGKWCCLIFISALIFCNISNLPCHAAIDQMSVIKNKTIVVNNAGSAIIDESDTISPIRWYDRQKLWHPDLYVWFRDYEPVNVEVVNGTCKISSDDQQHSFNYHAKWLGFAVCKKDRWQVQLGSGERVVTQDHNKVFTTIAASSSELTLNGTFTYLLPASAQNIIIDRAHRLITYKLITIPAKNATTTPPSVNIDLKFRPQLMSVIYKVYADPKLEEGACWVARTIFHNNGNMPIYNLRIFYKLGEYSELNIPERYTQVVPGGVVVDLYYPIISSQVTRLKTRTPVQLYVKYEYKDGKGQSYSDEIAEHLEFLGINQFLWSNLRDEERSDDWIDHFNNAPFVAAFVTRMDDAVKQFAGFISEAAGGAAASQSDDEALKWLQAAYNLMLENNIVYQTPSGFLTTEQATVQEIKFPRDVFRDKSGTCIDLAITYAALAESVGLNSWLLIIPEHCLPIIGLPSGKVVPVETTGLGGGTNRANFEVAIRAGSERLNQAAQKPHKLLDIRDLLSNEGIQNPELPPLTTDFFCGIKRTLTGTTQVETPTSTTEKPSGKETVLFADDFSNRNTGWFEENTSSDKYSYNNGRFELTIYKKNWWCGASAPPVIAANSYTVQTDMVDYGNSTYGIIFNISDWDQPFYYFIVNSQTQLFAVEKRFLEDNEVKWETIIGATKSNYINASGVNRLKVHQEGDTVSLYINGNFLISAKIQSYNSNIKVGLCAQTGDDVPATASFDNFLITAVATK